MVETSSTTRSAQMSSSYEPAYDAVVVGGGPAGLQATLTLARVHRQVLMVDSGSYRNDAADHMHNVVTHDGTPPAEFRAAGRKELAAYVFCPGTLGTRSMGDLPLRAVCPRWQL